MADLWTVNSSSPSQSPPFISSPPPLSSPSSFRNHGNPLHAKVTCPHLTHQTQSSSHHLHPAQVNSPQHLPPPQVTSPHHLHPPQVTSPHHLPPSQVTSPHHLHPPQVTSPQHLPPPQVTSPHHLYPPQVTSPQHLHPSQMTSTHNLLPPHVTSPHQLPPPQVTSPYHLPYTQMTSPHHLAHPQVTSPHHRPPSQVNTPHLVPQPQVSSPHLTHPQITSPHYLTHSQVTSPHYVPHSHATTSHHLSHSQITTPNLVPQPQMNSPHIFPPPQLPLSSQHPYSGLDDPNWNKSEHLPELSCLFDNYSCSYQNQTTAHLDLHLQSQNQFSIGVSNHGDELEDTHRLPYNTHVLLASGMCGQGDTPGPGQDNWGPLEPTLSQMQCSPLDSLSGGIALGRRSSMEFSSSSTEDFSNTQFFPDSYHDSNAPQSFCGPTTPGPGTHYPQTPTISSSGPQMHPRKQIVAFQTQTSTEPNRDQTIHESDPYPISSEPSQHHPHQTSRRLLPSQTEMIQDQTNLVNTISSLEIGFSARGEGQNVSSAAQSPSLPAGLMWRKECGGGRSTEGGGGGEDGQPDWTWTKKPQPENSTKVLDCRLLCTVCKRDFRSLPALNGHMRSHSGFRSATWLKKGENSSPTIQTSVSMVMPVSVPVQSRGGSKACRSGQRKCSRLSQATGCAVLYRSLMHLEEEKVVTTGNAVAAGVGDEEGEAGRGHYTPPPMLCPLRAGPGLYCSLATRRQQRVETVQLHNTYNGLSDVVATETLTKGMNRPRINVGRGFQAEIPPLHNHEHAHSDSQNALLLWTPWDELEKPANQQRVEAVLTMARSSVVPGGGASPEYVLHVLSECRGDILLTVEKLLSAPETYSNNFTGVSWSAAEMRLMVKSLQLHNKDFSSVQRDVQTKSLSQCVEFYYLWKKKLGLSVRTPAGLTITLPNTNGQKSSRSHDAS